MQRRSDVARSSAWIPRNRLPCGCARDEDGSPSRAGAGIDRTGVASRCGGRLARAQLVTRPGANSGPVSMSLADPATIDELPTAGAILFRGIVRGRGHAAAAAE